MKRKRRDSRIKKEDQHFTEEQWLIKKALYDNRCVYCWREEQELFRDHIIPISKGGPDIDVNVVPACKICNSKKSDNAPHVPFIILPLTPELIGRIICTIHSDGASSGDEKVATGKVATFFSRLELRTSDEKKMVVVRCPSCGFFLMKIDSEFAIVEANCHNTRCKQTILIKKKGSDLNVKISSHGEIEKISQA